MSRAGICVTTDVSHHDYAVIIHDSRIKGPMALLIVWWRKQRRLRGVSLGRAVFNYADSRFSHITSEQPNRRPPLLRAGMRQGDTNFWRMKPSAWPLNNFDDSPHRDSADFKSSAGVVQNSILSDLYMEMCERVNETGLRVPKYPRPYPSARRGTFPIQPSQLFLHIITAASASIAPFRSPHESIIV